MQPPAMQPPAIQPQTVGGNAPGIHAPIQQAQIQQKPAPAVPEVAGGRAVNKVAYVVFALLLGGLGIHKFYSGKIGMGILYLVFCWTFIPAIVAFIEAIIALTKPSDIHGNIYV